MLQLHISRFLLLAHSPFLLTFMHGWFLSFFAFVVGLSRFSDKKSTKMEITFSSLKVLFEVLFLHTHIVFSLIFYTKKNTIQKYENRTNTIYEWRIYSRAAILIGCLILLDYALNMGSLHIYIMLAGRWVGSFKTIWNVTLVGGCKELKVT